MPPKLQSYITVGLGMALYRRSDGEYEMKAPYLHKWATNIIIDREEGASLIRKEEQGEEITSMSICIAANNWWSEDWLTNLQLDGWYVIRSSINF